MVPRNVEQTTDGRTVWVNDEAGHCIGRFSARGIDVHASTEDQLAGKHCLFCLVAANPFAKKPTADAWHLFQQQMLAHHDVVVAPDLIVEFDKATP